MRIQIQCYYQFNIDIHWFQEICYSAKYFLGRTFLSGKEEQNENRNQTKSQLMTCTTKLAQLIESLIEIEIVCIYLELLYTSGNALIYHIDILIS